MQGEGDAVEAFEGTDAEPLRDRRGHIDDARLAGASSRGDAAAQKRTGTRASASFGEPCVA